MRTFRFGGHDDALWPGEPGDVVRQDGPRIGRRWWLVVDVRHARRWSHVDCELLEGDSAIRAAVYDANAGGTVWFFGNGTVHA